MEHVMKDLDSGLISTFSAISATNIENNNFLSVQVFGFYVFVCVISIFLIMIIYLEPNKSVHNP